IDSIDSEKNLLFIDSPTRYFLKTRDNARVYHAGRHLKESGIEFLSIGNKQSNKLGWDEESYSESGTGAYDAHYSHLFEFRFCENCWIRNVNTYHPEENTDDSHILSNCLLLNQSRNITVDSCFFQKPQYEGGGGNGYMFTLSSNDCLIKNSRANHSRHNYDFKYPYSNGNVIHNCIGENSKYASDFHMYLSMSNLFDVFTVNGDYLESTFRPYGGSAIHGYSSTQSVFYNTIGETYHPDRDYIIESKQFGWGYIIGTSGAADNVRIDPTAGSINDYVYNTSPRDFYEGIGEGEYLEPCSLYLDQLNKRLNDTSKHIYSVNILIKDELSKEPIENCRVTVYNQTVETDLNGIASFTNTPGMLILSLDKEFYQPVNQKQVLINSDTTITFLLVKKEFDVIFEILEAGSGNPVWYALVTFGDNQAHTDNSGTASFEVMEGNYTYSISNESFTEESGTLEVLSDTTFRFFLETSSANVKFRLKKGSTPVNNAYVAIGTDTLKSSSLGIVNFYNLAINQEYEYNIWKSGYDDIQGTFTLLKDTTIEIQMTVVGISDIGMDKSLIPEIWPNPVENILNIKFKEIPLNGIIKIVNMQGHVIYSKAIENNFIKIPTNNFPRGLFLTIVSGNDLYYRNQIIIN
ncbi:MAG: T9SS type A sorting domain-containing protein, partial [Prolixibacteraceae bacterium]|nr:T9SS type A sorting domain-containing protein [Prolixibacteraceae bacterium]